MEKVQTPAEMQAAAFADYVESFTGYMTLHPHDAQLIADYAKQNNTLQSWLDRVGSNGSYHKDLAEGKVAREPGAGGGLAPELHIQPLPPWRDIAAWGQANGYQVQTPAEVPGAAPPGDRQWTPPTKHDATATTTGVTLAGIAARLFTKLHGAATVGSTATATAGGVGTRHSFVENSYVGSDPTYVNSQSGEQYMDPKTVTGPGQPTNWADRLQADQVLAHGEVPRMGDGRAFETQGGQPGAKLPLPADAQHLVRASPVPTTKTGAGSTGGGGTNKRE